MGRAIVPYQITPIVFDGATRYVFSRRSDRYIPVLPALYEAFWAASGRAPGTTLEHLRHIAQLYAWADSVGIDLDNYCGFRLRTLGPGQIQSFAAWLHTHRFRHTAGDAPYQRINSILRSSAGFFEWLITYVTDWSVAPAVEIASRQETSCRRLRRLWQRVMRHISKDEAAPDLEDSEIDAIEHFLAPENRIQRGKAPAVAWRDYLLWRLVISFGLRQGEALALRLQHCPTLLNPTLRIVRIDERESAFDPRGPYAPRPKTSSRNLVPVATRISPEAVISAYCSRFRGLIRVSGNRLQKLGHDFLLVEHCTGRPLSKSAVGALAAEIRRETTVKKFHWHLARHAFFNRLNEDCATNPKAAMRIPDMLIYGGWRDERSLRIYTARSRRKHAEAAMIEWQRLAAL